MVLVERPISATLLAVGGLMLLWSFWSALRQRNTPMEPAVRSPVRASS